MISVFPLSTFQFICDNIPAAPAYGVYISQFIRYSRTCDSYQNVLDKGFLLTSKRLNQVFLLAKLLSSLRKFYGRHHDLVSRYGISVTNDHGYVPFVAITTRTFIHSWLITEFVTKVTHRMPLVEHDYPSGEYVSQLTTDILRLSKALQGHFLIHDLSPRFY